MRKLIYSINVSLDGNCDHTKMIPGEEIHEYFAGQLRDADVLLYGRKTYELMVPYWPDIARNQSATATENDFAKAFDAVKQIVVCSQSLEKGQGKNTKIIRGDLRDEIDQLKQEEGKDILVGGVDLASQLIALDLVDEFRIVVQPIIAGEGRRLMGGISLPQRIQLRLTGTKILGTGHVALHYSRA